jgi:hypothetical protein
VAPPQLPEVVQPVRFFQSAPLKIAKLFLSLSNEYLVVRQVVEILVFMIVLGTQY